MFEEYRNQNVRGVDVFLDAALTLHQMKREAQENGKTDKANMIEVAENLCARVNDVHLKIIQNRQNKE